MELDQNNITSTINKYLLEENLELYDINIVNFPNISKIEVFVYSSFSLDYKTIERLNFQIQRLLEEFNIQKGTYELIVSSPGVERLLKTSRHYEISKQELLKVKLIEPINDEYVLYGTLNRVEGENIFLNIDDNEINISINNIKKSRIVFDKFKEKVKG
ncbi:MAG: ribosome maturation factor RimP [Candidatus Actinomarina sp.]